MDFNYIIILVNYATRPLMNVNYAIEINSNMIKMKLFVIGAQKTKHFHLTRIDAIAVLASVVYVDNFRVRKDP